MCIFFINCTCVERSLIFEINEKTNQCNWGLVQFKQSSASTQNEFDSLTRPDRTSFHCFRPSSCTDISVNNNSPVSPFCHSLIEFSIGCCEIFLRSIILIRVHRYRNVTNVNTRAILTTRVCKYTSKIVASAEENPLNRQNYQIWKKLTLNQFTKNTVNPRRLDSNIQRLLSVQMNNTWCANRMNLSCSGYESRV